MADSQTSLSLSDRARNGLENEIKTDFRANNRSHGCELLILFYLDMRDANEMKELLARWYVGGIKTDEEG